MKKIVYSFLLFIISIHSAFAQINRDSILELQQVEILSANQKSVIPAQILKGEQLQSLNSYSVADAIRFFSGVQIKDYGGTGGLKTVDVRGMGSQHVGVFYDGIQLGNAQNGIVDLGKFSLDDLESISLYNGQKSNIFQSAKDYSTASSIYLQSKKPIFKENKSVNAFLSYKLGSIQLINPSVRVEYKINNQLSAVLSTEYIKTNGVYKYRYKRYFRNGKIAYDTVLKRRDGQVDAKRVELSLFGKGNNSNWNVKGYLYNSDRGIPAAIVRNQFDTRGQTLQDKDYFLQGTYERRIKNFQSKINAKFAYDFTHYIDTISSYKTNNRYTQREFYISWSNLYSINKDWDVNLSIDHQYNNMDADLGNFSYPTRNTNLVALASTYRFGKVNVQGSLLGTFVKDKVEKNTASPDKNIWTPTFIATYKPFQDQDFELKGFYKRVFRMPTFNDLYYTNIGYANLKPEYTTQYDLGFSYTKTFDGFLKSIKLSTDAYYNEVKDKIVAIPSGNMFRWTMMNLGRTKMKGIDVKFNTKFTLGNVDFFTMINYSYLEAINVTNSKDSYYKNQISYTPKNSGSFVLNSTWKTWNFNYSFIYVGERYNVHMDNIKKNRLNPWFTNDLGLQKMFQLNNKTLKISLELNNILNQQYDVVLNYPMPGRQFKLILNIDL
ncbi:TonB-dependent receptor domain-containing protein [Chishuiella sp.]|uniref:TonB-dependent receptor n=1 Tax=Chishuiella sp. TaxID=1969467 RepID=UPI0028A5EBDD|nr:TonB-dependent receptor [Chishuiella sp.]